MSEHIPLPFEVVDSEIPNEYLIYGDAQSGHLAEVHGKNAKELAEYIVRACNAYPELIETMKAHKTFFTEVLEADISDDEIETVMQNITNDLKKLGESS